MKTRKEFLEAVMKMAHLKDLKQADAAARAVISLTKGTIGEDLSQKIADILSPDLREGWESVRGTTEYAGEEEPLRKSLVEYKAIIEAFDGFIYICSNDYKVEFTNERFTQRTGYNPIGQECYKALYNLESICPWCVNEKVFQGETVRREVLSSKDNRWYYTISTPIHHSDGRLSKMEMIQDITERKKTEEALRESEERFRILVEESPVGVTLINKEGRYEYLNPSFVKMFGYHSEELPTGREWFRKAFPDSEYRKHVISTWKSDFEKPKVGESAPRTFEVTCKDGSQKTVFFRPVALREGNQLLIYEDISERKRMIEELQQAKGAAEAANRAKSTFLANMSHEMRTPLNAIIGYSELLAENAEDSGQKDLIPDLEKIREAGNHLLVLINEVLDLSKIEAGKMELYLETFDVSNMVEQVISTVQPLAKKKANSLAVKANDDLGTMHADLTKVRQTLFNMLSNACKFTDHGAISLEVARETLESVDYLVFRVSDTGIGMTEEHMAKLFQPFSQADALTGRTFGGTGLGLAISKRFCDLMGGNILVESKYGKGTTFTVRLPANVAERKPETVSLKEPAVMHLTEGARTVLVIDDDPAVCDLLTRYLNKENYLVETAPGGKEGLQLARKLHPDAITLDVLMPGMDGWAVLKEMKADPELADIPVIMLTIVDNETMGYSLGASDYFIKPIDRNRLVAVLSKLIHRPGKVLVVENDRATREMLRRMLVKEGWAIIEAENGRVALERMAESRPAFILLDLIMPEMDGFEFICELHKHKDWPSIPIAIITAKDLTSEERKRLCGRVEKILQKGAYSREELLSEVRDLLAGRARMATSAKE